MLADCLVSELPRAVMPRLQSQVHCNLMFDNSERRHQSFNKQTGI